MAQYRFDFFAVHALQQAGRDGNERRVLEGAGGERIRGAVVHGHVGHLDAGALGQLAHGGDQPLLGGIVGLGDDPRAGGPFGHGLAHQQRNEGTGEADDHREHQQLTDIDAARTDAAATDAEQVQYDGQHQHDSKVGGKEQHDAFHGRVISEKVGIGC
ncbi:unnamed protein product [Rhizophagus irregularis]|nr:unnamed protein product [Rhizophagus irregularis]